MELSLDLLKFILPELRITHFDITNHKTEDKTLHLYFEEKKELPKEVSNRTLIAHGFHKEITIEDFPLRGENVYLHVKKKNATSQRHSGSDHFYVDILAPSGVAITLT